MSDLISLYQDYTSEGEAPEHFHWWTFLGGATAYIGRSITLGLQYGLWNAHFICLVAPSGISRKSTALVSVKKLLQQAIEGEEDIDATVPIVIGEPTRASVLGDLGRATEEYGTTPPAVLINDEAGNILDDPKFVRLLDSLYTGDDDYDRRTEHSGRFKLKGHSLTVMTCTTPSWLGGALEQYGFGEGTMGRFIFPFAETRVRRVPWPVETNERKALAGRIVSGLRELRGLKGTMSVEPKAHKKFSDWYMSYECTDPTLKASGWESRVHTHVLKNAMGIALLRRQEVHMRMADLEEAFERALGVEESLWAVHQNINMNGDIKEVRVIELAIKHAGKDGIRHTPLRSTVGRKVGPRQFDEMIQHMIKSRVIHVAKRTTKGRPVVIYRHADYGPWNE